MHAHADLAVGDLAQRPAVLRRDTNTSEQDRPRRAGQSSPQQHDLLAEAVQAWRARPDKHAQCQKQLAMVDGEIRRNEQAIERYLLAFEAGTLQATVCGQRVRALTEATAGLRTHRQESVAELASPDPSGDTECLDGLDLRGLLEEAVADTADRPVVKALLGILVDEVGVEGRQAIYPTFRIPPSRPSA